LLKPEYVELAASVAGRLGFEPAMPIGKQPVVDHFPTLIRKTGWIWRGDYFDPQIPFSLELHFRCWDRETEGFGAPNLEQALWTRLCHRRCEELSFRALHPLDSVLYASLHMLRHLLRGSLRPSHVYEFAWFLHRRANDDRFWKDWFDFGSNEGRECQAICFALAQHWFSCAFHPVVHEAVHSLPSPVHRWLIEYAHSPLAAQFKPNKDELWLHWSLLRSPRQRLLVLRRRLIPAQLPGPVSGVHLKNKPGFKVRLQHKWTYACYLWQRLRYHLAALIPTSAGAAIWIRDSWRDRWPFRRAARS
jgi:hypothetical protein